MLYILAPTDFSNDAYSALFYATQLYKDQKCTFYIFHAFNRHSYNKKLYGHIENGVSLEDFSRKKTDEYLLESYHRIILDTENNPLHTFKTIAKHGDFLKQIKGFLKDNEIHLVVMGNKGKTGAIEIFLGSNTLQLVKSMITCPVLCIPKEIDFSPPLQLVFVTDFSHQMEEKSFSFLRDLAQAREAALHVYQICDDDYLSETQERNRDQLANYFQDICHCFHREPCDKSKAETVRKFVDRQKIDLLAMMYYRHYFLDKLFREPVVIDVSFYLEIPFLVLPGQD